VTAALVISLIVITTVAGVWCTKDGEVVQAQTRAALVRLVAYWLFTVLIAFELAAGALWDVLRIEYVRVDLTHLGYPLYLLGILGTWRIPGALTLLMPRFPRLKEWAYAGAFFDYTGAAASHFLVGHQAQQWMAPLIFSGITLLSWSLRPASRRLPGVASPVTRKLALTWAFPILSVVAMLMVAFLTLPKGGPPQ